MNQVELYDPHSGLAFDGAAAPLPRVIKDAADKLNRQKMSLDEAVEQLSEATEKVGGSIEIVEKHKYIKFQIGDPNSGKPVHIYRLLRYK